MITYKDLIDAVNRVNGHREGFEDSLTVKQLVLSLNVYKDRQEFDGTINSAKQCLKLAEYEIE
jgi:hypothetical protein